MSYKLTKRQIQQLNTSNEAARRFGEIGLGSVIDEISRSGGGSYPPDYDELRTTVEEHTKNISEINTKITEVDKDIDDLYNPSIIDAGGANNQDISVDIMKTMLKYTNETIEFTIKESPLLENEYNNLDEIAEYLSETNRYSDIVINIESQNDISTNSEIVLNGYGFRNITINFYKKFSNDTSIVIRNFNSVFINGNNNTILSTNEISQIKIVDCCKVNLYNFALNSNTIYQDVFNIKVYDCDSLYLNKLYLNKGDYCIRIYNTKILKSESISNIIKNAIKAEYIITTKEIYDSIIQFSEINNYLLYN